MQLHDVRTADLGHKKKVRVGRGPGSGIGKTCGRGLKGATARSGYTMKVTYEGGQMPFFRRMPKRGFRNGPFRQVFAVVNVGDLTGFAAGATVGPAELRAAGVLQGGGGLPVKVLGEGNLAVALNLKADAFSKSALEKIQKAGGKAEWIGGAPKKPAPDFKKLEAAAKKAKAAEKPKGKDEKKPEGGKPQKGEAPKDQKGGAPKPPKGEAPKAQKAQAPKPPKGQAPKVPKAEAPQAQQAEAPKPPEAPTPQAQQAEAPKPAEAEAPQAQQAEAPKPVEVEAPQAQQAEAPKPAEAEAPQARQTEAPKPAEAEAPKEPQAEAPKPVPEVEQEPPQQ
ncbi:MAG: 50S ribosomal protein L15 [Planctomycetota bacterium]